MLAGPACATRRHFARCRRGIGRTYQVPQPYGGMTTFENLAGRGAFRRADATKREPMWHCAAILEDCGLADKANVQAGMH